jgi:hypothetical protein
MEVGYGVAMDTWRKSFEKGHIWRSDEQERLSLRVSIWALDSRINAALRASREAATVI